MTKAANDSTNTIKIGSKTYLSDSVTENGTNIITDLKMVTELLQQQQLIASVTALAKGTLIEKLEEEAINFTEVPESDKSE